MIKSRIKKKASKSESWAEQIIIIIFFLNMKLTFWWNLIWNLHLITAPKYLKMVQENFFFFFTSSSSTSMMIF